MLIRLSHPATTGSLLSTCITLEQPWRSTHLQAYLNEFTFRFNRRFYPFNAFRSMLGIASGVTAPTYTERYAAKSETTISSGWV